ncbi:unnamed protein product [Clonostachys rosea]|uniref:Uncharacterized protein n=1 Tax=Bionectria ochroleuca TaxID=29856 RepID=A0ABY6U6Y8_BIOOC|nr:unnamed protein product [Clonostachys rosea]
MSSSTLTKYNLTQHPHSIPQYLLNVDVRRFHVEFLSLTNTGTPVTDINAKSNVWLKVDLLHEVQGVKGVRLEMQIDWSDSSAEADNIEAGFRPGQLITHPVNYEGPSSDSALTCTLDLDINRPFSFGDIIYAITVTRIQERFYFEDTGGKYFGCRDFIVIVFKPYIC